MPAPVDAPVNHLSPPLTRSDAELTKFGVKDMHRVDFGAYCDELIKLAADESDIVEYTVDQKAWMVRCKAKTGAKTEPSPRTV